MSIFVKVSWQWILFDLFSSFNSFNFDLCWDIKMLGKQYKSSFMTFTWVSKCEYQYFALICVCVSFLLCSPSAPFLPEYVNSFWVQLKTWCSFILRTVLGIPLQNQSSVKSLNDFSSRWHLIAALKDATERLPNWVFSRLMTQSHKQN